MIHCQTISGEDNFLNVRNGWTELFESRHYEPSVSFEWTYALLKTHLKNADRFFIVLIKDSEQILGFVPIVISKIKSYGFTLRNMRPLSEYYCTHSDLLFKEPSPEIINAFISALFSLDYKWDIFRIGRFIENNPIIDLIDSTLKDMPVKYLIKKEEPSFFLSLDSTFSDYLKKRSGKFRNYLNRMKKKLIAIGNLEYVRTEHFDDILNAYNQLLYVESKSWKHHHGTAISNIEKQRDFYEYLCKGASEKGRLHLFFLYLNNKPIAYDLGYLKDKTYFYIKTSFDEELRKLGPSTVLRAKLIEELILNGIKHFDFSGEPYKWETQWTNELRWHKSLLIYNNSFKAKLFSVNNILKQSMRKSFDENQFNFHDPRATKSEKT